MAEFDRQDDRVSNMEAPVSSGFFMDASGNPWNQRPDNVVQRYLSKVSLSKDEYWVVQNYINDRKWFELDLFIDRLMQTADRDDLVRLARTKEVLARINQENKDDQ